MLKIIFGIIFAGALYYVVTPLLGRRVGWVDAEDPGDERMRELELKKKINLKALKDIEFELASGKINDEDYLELKEHYSRKVSRIIGLIENLAEQEEVVDAHHGGRGEKDPEEFEAEDELVEGEEELDDDEEWDDDEYDEDEDDEDDDEDEIIHGRDGDDEDDEWDEDEDEEYKHRNVKGPTAVFLALALAAGVGIGLYQMGKKSAVPAPTASIAPQYAPSSDQAGLEHLVRYVQENPWNVTSHLILGKYYLGEGNTDLALSHFISAETVAPDDSRVLSSLGKTYRQLGNPDLAIVKLQAAVNAEPDSLEHLYQLGLVYGYDKNDREQAFKLFNEILSRQPDEELRAIVDEELKKLEARNS